MVAGRFWSERDNDAIDQFNKELVEDIVKTTCDLYSVSIRDTDVNVYGESAGGGKVYKKPVRVPCLITHEDITYQTTELGPSSDQNVTFAFLRNKLVELNVRPKIGDIIHWNYAYFEINTINENQLLGGDTEKNHDFLAICHMTKRSGLGLEERTK
jgi:hypothetical protein